MIPEPVTNTKKEEELSWDFLEEPVEEFAQEEIIEDLENEPEFQDIETMENEEPELSSQQRKARAKRNARQYVRMFSSGFGSLAASYADADPEEFTPDKEDQEELVIPLTELIYQKQIVDLPPGWMFIIALLIVFGPLALKAHGLRKENKLLEKKEKEAEKIAPSKASEELEIKEDHKKE